MLKHAQAVELLVSVLTMPHTNFGINEVGIHGQIIEDHLDDFEAWFKVPDTQFIAFGYQNTETGEVNRTLTVQFYMFALGRESLLLKQARL
ncbi:hypothetical protein F6R97_04175 [Pseudomonas sp. JV414]|uniref:hypothetical protein n=1 Tax=Pseudomonas sp. JV414 TaxID=1733110 RepID=UPI0028E1328C|nr:hypothetical protein [Pseudomonas sp. JV414]MDT9673851.1 hypothetical protein [Pseudomonas sp. JV414]